MVELLGSLLLSWLKVCGHIVTKSRISKVIWVLQGKVITKQNEPRNLMTQIMRRDLLAYLLTHFMMLFIYLAMRGEIYFVWEKFTNHLKCLHFSIYLTCHLFSLMKIVVFYLWINSLSCDHRFQTDCLKNGSKIYYQSESCSFQRESLIQLIHGQYLDDLPKGWSLHLFCFLSFYFWLHDFQL